MTSMKSQACFIGADDLRIGLVVHIDVGWMFHPFPRSSFKIQSHAQIATIRSLGLKQIRYSPDKSDPLSVAEETQAAAEAAPAVTVDPQRGERMRAVPCGADRRPRCGMSAASPRIRAE